MLLFSLLAVAAYCAVSLVLGFRLLALARRTRQLPETFFGFGFLAGGMVGYPFNVASGFLLHAGNPEAAHLCYSIAQVAMTAAAALTVLAWRQIFAPTLRGGGILVTAWSLLLVAGVVAVIRTTGAETADRMLAPLYWGHLLLQGGCYAISAVASLRYAFMLKRRLALGLADAIVTNRMQLWGFSHVSITCSYSFSIATGLLLASGLIERAQVAYLTPMVAGFGLTAAICITLAFLPPKAYLARFESATAATAAEGA